jgi:hypothetical protein
MEARLTTGYPLKSPGHAAAPAGFRHRAARQRIVEGAVGMAQMAIEKLMKESVVELDEERK